MSDRVGIGDTIGGSGDVAEARLKLPNNLEEREECRCRAGGLTWQLDSGETVVDGGATVAVPFA